MEQGYKYDRSNFINNPFDEKLMQISESMSFALPKYKAYNFVGGAQITPYARLKQWLLELRGREDAVEHLEYTVRKMELEIQMDEESKEFITDPKRKEMVNIKNLIPKKDYKTLFNMGIFLILLKIGAINLINQIFLGIFEIILSFNFIENFL